jgi:hypothetical protein
MEYSRSVQLRGQLLQAGDNIIFKLLGHQPIRYTVGTQRLDIMSPTRSNALIFEILGISPGQTAKDAYGYHPVMGNGWPVSQDCDFRGLTRLTYTLLSLCEIRDHNEQLRERGGVYREGELDHFQLRGVMPPVDPKRFDFHIQSGVQYSMERDRNGSLYKAAGITNKRGEFVPLDEIKHHEKQKMNDFMDILKGPTNNHKIPLESQAEQLALINQTLIKQPKKDEHIIIVRAASATIASREGSGRTVVSCGRNTARFGTKENRNKPRAVKS